MPRHLGRKSQLITEAAERENAALLALQTAEPHRVMGLAEEVSRARADKERAKSQPEDLFECAWCRDGKDESGEFRSKGRVVLEVTAVCEFDKKGETVREIRSREQPFYLVSCRGCNRRLGTVEHVME
ncbi:MAG: hypothetical protein WBV94_09755 [Blastocatellia bacterium]